VSSANASSTPTNPAVLPSMRHAENGDRCEKDQSKQHRRDQGAAHDITAEQRAARSGAARKRAHSPSGAHEDADAELDAGKEHELHAIPANACAYPLYLRSSETWPPVRPGDTARRTCHPPCRNESRIRCRMRNACLQCAHAREQVQGAALGLRERRAAFDRPYRIVDEGLALRAGEAVAEDGLHRILCQQAAHQLSAIDCEGS